jgi:Ca2+:H+ antiporter
VLHKRPPNWTWLAPIGGWALIGLSLAFSHPALTLGLGAGLIVCVLAAVHHAEMVACRVGEPFGTLVLAVAVTVIEVSLMIAGGTATAALARDTVFASIMIILNGMVGLCLLVGGSRHREQAFGLYGVNAALATLATLSVTTLILPNTTTSLSGPSYSASQLAFVATVSIVLYQAAEIVIFGAASRFGSRLDGRLS